MKWKWVLLMDSGKSWFELFYNLPSYYVQKFMMEPIYEYQKFIHNENVKLLQKIVDKNLKKPAEITCFLLEKYDYQNYKMDEKELLEYNLAQLSEIKKYQEYLERTEGWNYTTEEVIQLWSHKYSARFRKYWHLKKFINMV